MDRCDSACCTAFASHMVRQYGVSGYRPMCYAHANLYYAKDRMTIEDYEDMRRDRLKERSE